MVYHTYSYQVLYIYYFLLECTKHYDFAINIGTYNVISQLCIPEVYLFLEKKPIHVLFLDFLQLNNQEYYCSKNVLHGIEEG